MNNMDKMKIVVLDGYTLNLAEAFQKELAVLGECTYYERTPADKVLERAQEAEAVFTNKVVLSGEIIALLPKLKYIGVLATGYNVVDYKAAAERNRPVCNVPGYGTDAVAQFTFALLLELCHQVGLHSNSVHNGEWSACPDFCYWKPPQMELSGKTMGIIGYGAIGQAVGNIARAFGMDVLAYSRTHHPEHSYVDLDTLLANSDIISLHCPLFPENTGMISKETIGKMKDGAILLNTARGGLVNEQAVAEALASGKLKGYAADVVITEPIPANSPLIGAKNCILTPHMAWAPIESRQRILDATVENIRRFLSGKPKNVVN